ncbi:hypothetical protein SDC9_60027 [bioreactor metagenome]|uniref:Uncharacterized protein n=1 Tax=bioreactor metagenome TaxID=1076179 RepID=A0A644XD20_9ZZZZ
MVGSHTFTGLYGIENLALKLKKSIKELEVVRFNEEHYEANVKK